ncbi:MAG: 1-acyl-sn-glycerol-3-phosphate acyltransferase [Kiritimatiellae bacterium]|nr:1-acyl-sn-glycerol-3-phosphate acyltransferase [Kiritimatiellia bacterium]
MRKTELSAFQEELRATGGYRTKDDHRAPKRARPGFLTTLRYSWGVGRVFPCCAVAQPLGKLTTELWARLCFSSVTAPEALGMRVEIEGFEKRASFDGPVVYLCNHMSMTETILLPPVLLSLGPFSYVAKASLAHLPFLEKAAARMKMVPISRKSPREDLISILKTGTERIGGGDSFLIFPQGARYEVFDRAKYSSIGAKLAEKANCPVVPIVVDTRCQPTRRNGLFKKIFKDFGPVDTSKDIRVACGPVIPAGRSRAMHEAAFDWMAGKLESWGLPVRRGA